MAHRVLFAALLGVPLVEVACLPAGQRANDSPLHRSPAKTGDKPSSILGRASLPAPRTPAERMEQGFGATFDFSAPIGIALEGPVAQLAKWGITLALWGHFYNFCIVEIDNGWLGFLTHFWDIIFFPITLVVRHAWEYLSGAAGSLLPDECSWIQRAFMGGDYCDRLKETRKAVEEAKQKGNLSAAAAARCSK